MDKMSSPDKSSGLKILWVLSIPDSGIVVSSCGNHNSSHDGGNVEGWPVRHKLVNQSLFIEVFVSSFVHFFLNGDSSGVMQWVRIVPIVIGLDDEPVCFTELIESMD